MVGEQNEGFDTKGEGILAVDNRLTQAPAREVGDKDGSAVVGDERKEEQPARLQSTPILLHTYMLIGEAVRVA